MQTLLYFIIFHWLPITKTTVHVITKLWIFVTVQEPNDVINRLSKLTARILKIMLWNINRLLCSKSVCKKNCRPPLEGREVKKQQNFQRKYLMVFRGEKKKSTISLYRSVLSLCVVSRVKLPFLNVSFLVKRSLLFTVFALNLFPEIQLPKSRMSSMVWKLSDLWLIGPCSFPLKCHKN